MERRQSLFEFRHAALKYLAIFFYQSANQIQVAQGHCREDVVSRTPFDEERCHLGFVAWRAVWWMEKRRPSDRIELVLIPNSVRVSTGVKQSTHDFDVSIGGRPV